MGNYFMPIFLGAPEVVYPRVNNISILILPLSYTLIILSVTGEFSNGTGWTLYPPLIRCPAVKLKLFLRNYFVQYFYLMVYTAVYFLVILFLVFLFYFHIIFTLNQRKVNLLLIIIVSYNWISNVNTDTAI